MWGKRWRATAILGLLCCTCSKQEQDTTVDIFVTSQAPLTYCRDIDGDYHCGEEEILGRSGADGKIVLDEGCASTAPLLVEGVMPMISDDPCRFGVTPMTTLATLLARREKTSLEAAFKATAWTLGVSPEEGTVDSALNTYAAVFYRESADAIRRDRPDTTAAETVSQWHDLLLRYGDTYAPQMRRTASDDAAVRTAASAGTLSASSSSRLVPFQSSMTLGIGYDGMGERVMGNAHCLAADDLAPIREVDRNVSSIEYSIARNVAELADVLGISLNFALSLSTIEVNLEASFLRELEQREDSLFIVLELVTEFADYAIAPKTLADPVLSDMYFNDYEAFRSWCGDMYLASVATGVSYVAVLEIQTRNAKEKLDIAAKVWGEYTPLDLEFAGGFKFVLGDIAENYNFAVHILSRGVAGDLIPAGNIHVENAAESAEGLVADIESFLENADAARQKDDLLGNYPLKARFISYEELLGESDATLTLEQNRALLRAYREAYQYVDETMYQVRAVLAATQLYDIPEGGVDALYELEEELVAHKSALRTATLLCESKGAEACVPIDDHLYLNLDALRSMLPKPCPKYPASCAELKEQIGTSFEDGVYDLYIGNNEAQSYTAFCKAGPADTVETYLVLGQKSAGIPDLTGASQPLCNFSRAYIDISDDNVEQIEIVQSVYEMLLVTPFGEGLVVAKEQTFGVATAGDCDGPRCPERVPFGHGHTCSRHTDTHIRDSGDVALALPMIAQIDLNGTPFHLAPDVVFVDAMPLEIVREPMTCSEARAEAEAMGGRLLTVLDEAVNERYARFLKSSYLAETWLNLSPVKELIQDDIYEYAWRDTMENPSYRAWRDENERVFGPGVDPDSICVTMANDGKWDEIDAAARRSFVVQHGRLASDIQIGADGKTVDIRARERLGGCGGLMPSENLVLVYDAETEYD